MKNFLLIICVFIFVNAYGQNDGKSYFFKQVGWTVNLPPAFKILDSAANAEINEKGRKVMESALEAVGLEVGATTGPVDGVVAGTDIAPGTRVERGTKISVIFGTS